MDSGPTTVSLEDDHTVPQPTLYETAVLPGQDSIIDDPLLKRTTYIINTMHNTLICTECKHAVNPGNASSHIKKLHKACRLPSDFSAQLKLRYPNLIGTKIQLDEVADPVFGLAIQTEPFLICGRCSCGYRNEPSWRSHECLQAGRELGDKQPPYTTSLVQTFFRGPKCSYFPIHTPLVSSTQPPDAFAIFKSQSSTDTCDLADAVSTAEDYRQLNQFFAKEQWISHVSGLLSSDICSITSTPRRDEGLELLSSATYALMSNIQSIIGNSGFILRRLLGKRPS